MENKEFVIVVDFGGQYNQLIARRVREITYTAKYIHTTKRWIKLRN